MTPSVEHVIDLLTATFGAAGPAPAKFRAYLNGDPEVIPAFNLPCAIVSQTRDDTTEAAYGQDDVTDEIRIKLLFDKRDDYTGKIELLNTTEKRLRDLVGRVNANNEYEPGTVKRMLREAFLDNVTAIAPTMSVEYGINERNTLGDSDNAQWTAEAWITFTITYSVNTNQ